MMPGITIGRVEHDLDSSAFGYGRTVAGSFRRVQQIATNGKTIAMVSHGATTMTSTSVNVYYSNNNGVTWTAVPGTPKTSATWATNGDVSIGAITYEDGKWIVVTGDSVMWYTTDITANWSTWTSTGTAQTTLRYSSISYSETANPKWVVYGTAAAGVLRVNSTTFGTWTTAAATFATNCNGITSGKLNGQDVWIGLFPVATGIFQYDGATFATRTAKTYPGTVNARSLIYVPQLSLWVAACDNSVIYTSPDTGTDFTWTARTSNTTEDLASLTYVDGIGIVCGTCITINSPGPNELGRIIYSKNGTTWTLISAFDSSVAAYGYGFGGVQYNGSVLMQRSENTGSGIPHSTANGSFYTAVVVADR